MARHVRRGFTLVEMLIVITVMLVLMGIAVLAYRHIENATAAKATVTRLEMCQNIFKEFDASASLSLIEGVGPPTTIFVTGASETIPKAVPQPPGIPAQYDGDVTPQAGARTQINPTGAPAVVQSTGMVFQVFSRFPNVKTMLNQLPAGALLQADVTDSNFNSTGFIVNGQAMPIILDGWKNPIIYVPSGGLTGVIVGGPLPGTVDLIANPTALVGHSVTVQSADGRPFFASAGPDGNFKTGDDNVYSCPVVYH